MRRLVTLALLAAIGCGPKCLRGHDERVWIAEDCQPVYTSFPMGHDMAITVQVGEVCTPAHWGTRFVCDQYELEKAP